MIINRLKLENWKTFDNAEFTFTPGVNIVEGSNYSGKTSFIQALYFALFNETLFKQLTAKFLKKEGEKHASVALDFAIETKEYRIRRNISGEKVIKTESYIYHLENGREVEELESVSTKGAKLSKIEEIFNVSSRFTKNINFIQEDSIPTLLNNPKTKILEDISNILQLDYFTKIKDYCEKGIKQKEKQVKELENKYNQAEVDLDSLKENIATFEEEIDELTNQEENLKNKISIVEGKLKKYNELDELISSNQNLESQIRSIEDKMGYISSDLESLERELKELEDLEKDVEKLKKKSVLYRENQKKLIELNNSYDSQNNELNKAKQSDLLIDDKKAQLDRFQEDLKEIKIAQKKLEEITPKFVNLEEELSKYSSALREKDDLNNNLEQEIEIVENFKKGTCPITKGNCPVSENLIEEYASSIEKIKIEIHRIEEKIQQMKNPEQEYYDLLRQKSLLKEKIENITKVKHNIENIREEIKRLTQNEAEKNKIEGELKEIKKKIELIEQTNQGLQKQHEDYFSKKERAKGKKNLVDKVEDKKSEIQKLKEQLLKTEDKVKNKKKEIEEFKKTHNIGEISELNNENKQYEVWKKQLSEVNLKMEKDIFKKKEFEKQKDSLLKPYKSIGELREEIERLVHKQYKIIFFQEALNNTLQELKSRKLKLIKDICNKMWHKFRINSGSHLIDWDDNFLPILKIGGTERNLYQLSSSEKMFIYFSIRAALLAELGPNYFIVIDNLLNPFMAENQKIVTEQIKQVVDETNIRQVIFTGFDISPDVKSDNHIKI